MADSCHDDMVWQTVAEWIIRKQESPLDSVAAAELIAWLEKDSVNRAAYEEASHVWRLTGLVPRSDET